MRQQHYEFNSGRILIEIVSRHWSCSADDEMKSLVRIDRLGTEKMPKIILKKDKTDIFSIFSFFHFFVSNN